MNNFYFWRSEEIGMGGSRQYSGEVMREAKTMAAQDYDESVRRRGWFYLRLKGLERTGFVLIQRARSIGYQARCY